MSAQQAAEAAIEEKEQRLGGTIQGALVAVDPNTGHVKALVGGRGDSELNLATGKGTNPTNPGRPCGSTFKTFTLIAALEAGINPKTMVDCTSPAVIPDAGYPASNPLNNINNQSFGNISMQKAFAKSSNTGFVRLEMAVGIDKVINTAKNMGITSPLNPVGSLTLGQQNVTVLDLAKSYAPIANGGTKYDAQPILRISDKNGNIIADNSAPGGERVMSPEVAKATTDVMKTVVTDPEGTGGNARLANGQEVAAKTGTSSDYKDITFCGITPQLSVAIWFGDPSNVEEIPVSVSAGTCSPTSWTRCSKVSRPRSSRRPAIPSTCRRTPIPSIILAELRQRDEGKEEDESKEEEKPLPARATPSPSLRPRPILPPTLRPRPIRSPIPIRNPTRSLIRNRIQSPRPPLFRCA